MNTHIGCHDSKERLGPLIQITAMTGIFVVDKYVGDNRSNMEATMDPSTAIFVFNFCLPISKSNAPRLQNPIGYEVDSAFLSPVSHFG